MVLSGRNACHQYLQILKQVWGNDQREGLGGESTRGGNGFGTKRPGYSRKRVGDRCGKVLCFYFSNINSAMEIHEIYNYYYLGNYGNAIKT